jgi:hypothetical protein
MSARRAYLGVVVLLAVASGSHTPLAVAHPNLACGGVTGPLSNNVGNIKAHNVSCYTARRVTRAWRGTRTYSAYGFFCRYRDTGYEAGKITCRRGAGTVVFYTSA